MNGCFSGAKAGCFLIMGLILGSAAAIALLVFVVGAYNGSHPQ